MKYKVVTGQYSSELNDLVNALIDDGWVPHGGVSVCTEISENPNSFKKELQTTYIYAQAMICGSA